MSRHATPQVSERGVSWTLRTAEDASVRTPRLLDWCSRLDELRILRFIPDSGHPTHNHPLRYGMGPCCPGCSVPSLLNVYAPQRRATPRSRSLLRSDDPRRSVGRSLLEANNTGRAYAAPRHATPTTTHPPSLSCGSPRAARRRLLVLIVRVIGSPAMRLKGGKECAERKLIRE